MSIPGPGEYQEAFQSPSLSLLDPDLAAGETRRNALGLPQPIAGAFAIVFSVDTPNGRFAARCFLTDVRHQKVRYAAISRHLQQNPLPFLVDFEYQKRGIRIGEGVHPILKMQWAQGMPLNRWVSLRLNHHQELESLAHAWTLLTGKLDAAGIAHGDLQHGNILVRNGLQGEIVLTLVDYDTMYVPELRGRQSPEIGHRNYQHSERSSRHFDPRLDRFSALAIYAALRALAVRPDLWAIYDTGENLLFQADDFYRPGQSRLFADLRSLDQVGSLSAALERASLQNPLEAPTITEALRSEGTQAGTDRRTAYRASPVAGTRDPFERAAGWGLSGIAVLTLILSFWTLPGALAVSTSLSLAASGAFVRHYATREEIARRRRLSGEIGQIRRIRSQLDREVQMLEAERVRLLSDKDGLRQRHLDALRNQVLQDRLRFRFVGELEGVEGVSHKAVIKLKKAGIRTALHVTRERLDDITGLGPASRASILEWHNELINRLSEGMPTELPENELRRIERDTIRRRDELAIEVDRAREKVQVQRMEEERVLARLAGMPLPSMLGYLAYVLRLSDRNPLTPVYDDSKVGEPASSEERTGAVGVGAQMEQSEGVSR